MYRVNGKEYECSVIAFSDVFNDKWKVAIVWNLLKGEKRFNELTKVITGITQKTLTVKLRELEDKNIIHREVFAEVPIKVVYSLTNSGESLRVLFKQMYTWGLSYIEEHGEIDDDIKCGIDI